MLSNSEEAASAKRSRRTLVFHFYSAEEQRGAAVISVYSRCCDEAIRRFPKPFSGVVEGGILMFGVNLPLSEIQRSSSSAPGIFICNCQHDLVLTRRRWKLQLKSVDFLI